MSNSDAAGYDSFYQSLLGDFLGESEQLLVALNKHLLRLDEWVRSPSGQRQPSGAENLLSEMSHSIHSLMRLSNMLGLDEIEHFAEPIEAIFETARKNLPTLTGNAVELLFEAIDRLANLIDALKDSDVPAVEHASVTERMLQWLESAGVRQTPSDHADTERTLDRIESQVADVLDRMAPAPDTPTSASRPDISSSPKITDSDEGRDLCRTPPGAEPSVIARSGNDATSDTTEAPSGVAQPANDGADDCFADLIDEADMSSRFISIFIDETELALDQLTENLLNLEAGGAHDELKLLLVISHRIKGSAAAVGLNRAARLSHLMEDLLQDVVNVGKRLSADVTDAMLKCVDELRQYVEGLKQGTIPPDHFRELAAGLLQARQGTRATGPGSSEAQATRPAASPKDHPAARSMFEEPPAAAGPETTSQPAVPPAKEVSLIPVSEQLREKVIATAPIGLPVYAGVATFQPDLPLVSLKAELLYEKLSNLGDVSYFDPPPERFDTIEKLQCVQFGLATERPEQEITRTMKTSGVIGMVLEPLFYGPGDDARTSSDRGPAAASTASQGTASSKAVPPAASTPACSRDASPRPPSAKPTDASRPAGRAASKPTETLRVDIDRLDQLMNLAGQLVVSKARFTQISDRLRTIFGNKRSVLTLNNVLASLASIASFEDEVAGGQKLEAELGAICAQARRIQNQLEPMQREVEAFYQMHASVNELEEAVHQLERVADDIQKNVMDTRMVPIGPLFTRFHRVIRDITRASNKSIRLEIHGEKTELDKRMIDELGDPLIHMVRNSADHGIETPDQRVRAGKPAEGTITLDACHRGNNILIQITDDGKGLDPNHILAKALEQDLISSAEAERMTNSQIYQLIWKPGFSTAQKVTDFSGRGVGMDIVRSRVEALNGTVELDSTPKQGTTITIKLPLTLAILPSLMVDVGGDVFAMPMESVAEIVSVRSDEVATVHGTRATQVRGRVISIVHFDEVFQWNTNNSRPADRANDDLTLVIVGEGDEEIGLAVDRVIGEEDVVIKSMADNYKHVPGIAGASVLGDGRVSLILDLAAVIAMSARAASGATVPQMTPV
ncbi:MAG: chemotaxis protein CheW [Pirellulales bacterium]|nr:chemotaxis protein CheW [Pirellulales bacterium]